MTGRPIPNEPEEWGSTDWDYYERIFASTEGPPLNAPTRPTPTTNGHTTATPPTHPEAEIVETSRFQEGGRFILDDTTDLTALWGDPEAAAWADGESLLIVGPQGTGKSTLMQQLMLRRHSILTDTDGRPHDLLGMHVQPAEGPGRALLLAMDRPKQIKRSLRRMVGEEHRDLLDQAITVWQGPPPEDLARHPERLTMMAGEAGATHIYLDSIKDAAVGISGDEEGAGLNRSLQMCLADGRQIVGIHHQRKAQQGGGKPRTLDDVYGSTWITSGAGSVILLWGKAGDPVLELEHLKQPNEPVGPMKVLHDLAAGTMTVHDTVDLVQLAATAGGSHGLTVDQAARSMFTLGVIDTVSASQREKARRKLKNLANRGLLQPHEHEAPAKGGRAYTTYTVPARAPEPPSS